MSEDFSYFYGRPRAVVHGGTPPPRQGMRGGRRVFESTPYRLGTQGGERLEGESNTLVWVLLGLALLWLSRR